MRNLCIRCSSVLVIKILPTHVKIIAIFYYVRNDHSIEKRHIFLQKVTMHFNDHIEVQKRHFPRSAAQKDVPALTLWESVELAIISRPLTPVMLSIDRIVSHISHYLLSSLRLSIDFKRLLLVLRKEAAVERLANKQTFAGLQPAFRSMTRVSRNLLNCASGQTH